MERVSLGHWTPPWIRREHAARYVWACAFTQGRRVVDAACGTGYGTAIVARQGQPQSVDGFDISAEAIGEARQRHHLEGRTQFRQADVAQLPVDDQSYDLFLSFETVEHLADDRALVREAVRVLKPGGRFICSTPNRQVIRPGTTIDDRPLNRFHLREYSFEEFAGLLRPQFSKIEWYGQNYYGPRYCGLLNLLGWGSPTLAARSHQLQKLASSLWKRPAAYDPQALTNGDRPEILIAVATV